MSAVITPTQARTVMKSKKPRLSDFNKLRLKVGLHDKIKCAEFCGVTVRTVTAWDIKGAPLIAMRLLHLYDRQDLSGLGSDWAGFRFSRGKLICGRLSFSPKNLKSLPYLVDLWGRVESAKIRLQDGLPVHEVWGIVAGSSAFSALPDLRE